MSRGKRYDEPKLNKKKVVAVIIAIAALVMFIISLKSLLTSGGSSTNEGSTVTSYFTVYENDKYGVIDNEGNIIIDIEYDEMIVIPDSTLDLFIITENVDYDAGTYVTKVLNSKGKEILTDYEMVEAIENYDSSDVWYESNVLTFRQNGKYGLINFSGKELVPAEYDNIYALQGVEKSIIIEKDGLVGLVSSSLGEIIIEAEYAEIESLTDTYENGYIVRDINSYYGVITTDKKTALDFAYDEILHVYGNNMYVVRSGGTLEVVNKSGEVVLDSGFSTITEINVDYFTAIDEDGNYGVINVAGEAIIPFEYESIKFVFDDVYIIEKNDLYGLMHLEGDIIVDPIYTSITYRKSAGFIEADKEDYTTDIIDGSLNLVLSNVIISDINIDKGYIRVRIDGEYKYYNLQFEEKEAQDVRSTNTLFLFKENGKYGYKNKDGEIIVDAIYDDATEQNEYGYAAVKKDGVWGAIKSDGTLILEPSVNLDNNLVINFIDVWHLYEDSNTNIYIK